MSSNVVLFTRPDCKKCEYVKGKIPGGLDVTVLDLTTPDGMAEAAFYELIGKHTPILVVDEVEVVEGAVNIKNRLERLGQGG